MNDERKIVNIPINKIVPNIYQPRIIFDNKSLEDLSNSIKKYGIIQPLVLRKLSDKYEIIDGERRYKAAKRLSLEEVPAIVLDIEDKEIAELILNENIQKQLLNPIEEANAYEQIMLLNKCTTEELSKITGKDIKQIENKLILLNLPPEVQEGLLNKKISESHARLLTKIEKRKDKLDLYNRILKERLTIKEVEKIINSLTPLDHNSIKKQKKEIDKFNLEELNMKDFITKQKELKMEEKNMNDQNMNFNQYNGLLKEQEKPQMENNGVPEPILQGNIPNPKPTDFFPSLEEQPLNTEVPTNINGAMPMTPPPVDMSMSTPTDMTALDVNQNVNGINVENNYIPNMPMPEVLNQPFEMPTLNNNEVNVNPTFNGGNGLDTQNNIPNMQVNNEMPMQMPEFNQVNNNENTIQGKELTPAIAILKDVLPLLNHAGFNVTLEESDVNNEHLVTFKIQK